MLVASWCYSVFKDKSSWVNPVYYSTMALVIIEDKVMKLKQRESLLLETSSPKIDYDVAIVICPR